MQRLETFRRFAFLDLFLFYPITNSVTIHKAVLEILLPSGTTSAQHLTIPELNDPCVKNKRAQQAHLPLRKNTQTMFSKLSMAAICAVFLLRVCSME